MHISEQSSVQIEVADLSHISEPEARVAEARKLGTEFRRIPFSMLTEQLVRMKLFRLSPTDHVLVVTVHHILVDAESIRKIVVELLAIYQSYVTGTPSGIEKKPALQYTDYAAWQNAWMTDERQAYFLQAMKTRLSEPLVFPEDPAATPAGKKVQCPFVLSNELMDAIGVFAKKLGTTKYLVILTALAMALSKWVGQSKVQLASVGNLRINEQLVDMVGPFAAFDLLCADLSNVGSFDEAVARVHRAFSESQDNRAYAPSTEYKSLVNVFVDYVPAPDSRVAGGGDATAPSNPLTANSLPMKTDTFPLLPKTEDALSQWALIVIAGETQGRVSGSFVFSLARFGRETVEKAISRFQALLQDNVSQQRPR